VRQSIAQVTRGLHSTGRHAKACPTWLAAGCPIATGVIEGACRHLVKDRMERSGMRWTQTNAQAMLNIRAVHQSSYWDDFHQQRVAKRAESSQTYSSLLGQLTPLAG